MSRRLLVATGNRGKLREYATLLRSLGVAVEGLEDHPGVELPPETGTTFEANALLKARAAAAASGVLALADDSGLAVHALDGRPGVFSARYGPPGLDDAGRCQHLLEELSKVEADGRGATFVCVIAVARPDGHARTLRGETHGRILTAGRGEGGFGYDPLFLVPELGQTYAELDAASKNRISHRGRAVTGLPALLGPASDLWTAGAGEPGSGATSRG